MDIYKSAEEYLKRYPDQNTKDSAGNLLNVGDKVALLRDETRIWTKDTIGTIACFTRSVSTYVGVVFETPDTRNGSTLEGCCHDSYGSWVRLEYLQLVTTIVEPDEEGLIKGILAEITKTPQVALLSGKFYELTLKEHAPANGLLQPLLDKMAARIRTIQAEASTKVRQAEEKASQQCPMPEISLEHVRKGMVCYKPRSYLVYIMPLHYAPQFIGRDSRTPTKEISPEHQKQLVHDVFFRISVDNKGYIYDALLYTTPQLTKEFVHYHGEGMECFGTIEPRSAKTPDEAFAFRDKYENALRTINDGHRMTDKPELLLNFDTINKAAHTIVAGQIWTTKTLPEKRPLQVGDLVKVLSVDQENLADILIGTIGKLIEVGTDLATVEFLFKLPNGLTTDVFNLTRFELAPPGSRRSRKPANQTAPDEPLPATTRQPWTIGEAAPDGLDEEEEGEEVEGQLKVGDTVRLKPGRINFTYGRGLVDFDQKGIIMLVGKIYENHLDWGKIIEVAFPGYYNVAWTGHEVDVEKVTPNV